MSYDLHSKLAEEYGGREKWGYRTVDTLVSFRYIESRPQADKLVYRDRCHPTKFSTVPVVLAS